MVLYLPSCGFSLSNLTIENMDLTTKIIQLIISCTTLVFAILIYKNSDLKKTFRQKQLEVVFNLANTLEKQKFKIGQGGIDPNADRTGYYFDMASINVFLVKPPPNVVGPQLKRGPLLIEKNSWSKFEFLRYGSNPFLPKKIAEEIRKFGFASNNIDINKTAQFIYVYVSDSLFPPDPCMVTEGYTHFSVYKDLESYVKQIIHLKKVITEWLKDYGIDDLNIIPFDGPDNVYDIVPIDLWPK